MDDFILKHIARNNPNSEERVIVTDNNVLVVTVSSRSASCNSNTHAQDSGSMAAISYCTDCGVALCTDCLSNHQSSDHYVVSCGQFPDPVIVQSSVRDISDTQVNKSSSNGFTCSSSDVKPAAIDVDCTRIVLAWPRPTCDDSIQHYEIRYRKCHDVRWQKISTNDMTECILLQSLAPNVSYETQVRPVFVDREGPYGPKSDPIKTKKSLAQNLRDDRSKTVKICDGTPSLYRVQLHEKEGSVNTIDKTRKCFIKGRHRTGVPEKTVLLVGATGSGKTTLIDAIFNHILGMEWSDDFRFTVVNLKQEEDARKHDQALSQTDWITCYEIPCMDGSKVDFKLNLVDTPGFADTRGIERDTTLVRQIRSFFTPRSDTGINKIDALCFVVQAPLVRLSAAQRYVFDGILSIFGKDIIGNIFMLITFADGSDPVVLSSLKEAKIPYEKYFTFNNSALFANNVSDQTPFSKSFWQLGEESYQIFFKELVTFKPKSLLLTSEVLENRERLDAIMVGLLDDIKSGLNKMENIRQEEHALNQHEAYIRANKNYRYKVKENKMNHIKLKPGENALNCLRCHRTCHFPCRCRTGAVTSSYNCTVMDSNNKCTICVDKCPMTDHCDTGYRYELSTVEKERTYEELKSRFDDAKSKESKSKSALKKLKYEYGQMHTQVQFLINNARECFNQLSNIALRPNPLNESDYIDLLITNEKQDGSVGYLERIEMLKDIRQKASLIKFLPDKDFDPLSKK
ncbi:hypothetical protein FSP39_016189 [Pinctada imbricata]|uniref:Fibronectin type-III domain-containing protein n=1 Tax=Pinctada imbricata TaxID=66713 RepID=A0AA88XMK6_PINIB|nr:hypothetical protein FSP39_016189 [Pinctada imbricata]